MSSVVYNWYRLGVKIYFSPPEKQDSDTFWVFSKISDENPRHFIWESPPLASVFIAHQMELQNRHCNRK